MQLSVHQKKFLLFIIPTVAKAGSQPIFMLTGCFLMSSQDDCSYYSMWKTLSNLFLFVCMFLNALLQAHKHIY